MSTPVNVDLSGDEALVLFEWISKLDVPAIVQGEAERHVLWSIEAKLERALVEPFAANYSVLVEHARARIVEAESEAAGKQ